MNKKSPKKYKETSIGKVPSDWEVVRLGVVFDICAGGDIYKLNYSKQKNEKFKFPIYSNSLENCGLYGYADSYQYPRNCITVTGRGTLGKAMPRFEKFNAIIRLLVLIPKKDIDLVFVSEYINDKISFNLEKTSIPQLTVPKFAKYKIPLPPLLEQQKIAEILGTVDEGIEKVDKAIEKAERLKKGLMQELLTKGIGHKEFKDSKVGKIPKEWELKKLIEVTEGTPMYGANSSSREYDENLPRYVRITDISDEGYLKDEDKKSLSYNESKGYFLEEGDIVFARSGATVGKTYLYKKEDGECAFAGYLIRFKVNNQVILPKYLLYYTHSHFYYHWINSIVRSTAQPNINAREYSLLKVLFPTLSEQQRIVEILSTVDKKIDMEIKRKEKLERIKKGLMQDLLTGRKRVRVSR
jgi:type I restriction enzyme S subunit